MIRYLRNRAAEWSTRGAVLCFVALCAWVTWQWHVEIWHMIAAGIAAIVASVPSRAPAVVWCLAKKLFTKPAVGPSTTARESAMATTAPDLKTEFLESLPAFLGGKVQALGPDIAAIWTKFEAFKAAPGFETELELAGALFGFGSDVTAEIESLRASAAAPAEGAPQ